MKPARQSDMDHGLAPDIHVAAFDDRVVILDVASNRYRLLRGELALVLSAWLDHAEGSDHAAFSRLVDLGVLVRGSGRHAAAIADLPTRSALEEGGHRHSLTSLQIGAALAATLFELNILGFRRSLARASGRMAAIAHEADRSLDAVGVARGYAWTRPTVPIGRICLRDSLALTRLLASKAVPASLVFGVRLDPFLAHCWVQQDEWLLTDTLHLVGEYRPILVL